MFTSSITNAKSFDIFKNNQRKKRLKVFGKRNSCYEDKDDDRDLNKWGRLVICFLLWNGGHLVMVESFRGDKKKYAYILLLYFYSRFEPTII
jgi:hypothetical protein